MLIGNINLLCECVLYLFYDLCTKSFYYRSDHQAIIAGLVLEVMFEFSTDAYVYKYQDLTSKSIECIAIEELSACEWFVKGKPVQIEVMVEIQKQNKTLKPTTKSNNKTQNTDQNQTNLKVVNTSNAIAVKRKSHSFVEEYGPPKSIFNAVPLDKG